MRSATVLNFGRVTFFHQYLSSKASWMVDPSHASYPHVSPKAGGRVAAIVSSSALQNCRPYSIYDQNFHLYHSCTVRSLSRSLRAGLSPTLRSSYTPSAIATHVSLWDHVTCNYVPFHHLCCDCSHLRQLAAPRALPIPGGNDATLISMDPWLFRPSQDTSSGHCY